MDDSQRGKIRNRDLAQRIMDFSDLRWGRITPTDIDAVVEFANRCFVIIEAKGDGVPVQTGQRMLLERMLLRLDSPYQNHALPESRAIVIIADCDNEQRGDVNLALCPVRQTWVVVRSGDGVPSIKVTEVRGWNVLDTADAFIKSCGIRIDKRN